MRLSMYMLERWLAEYNPTSIILEGKRRLVGARLFTNDTELEDYYVYIVRSEELASVKSDEALLVNGRDAISVKLDDFNAVFNSVLAAFDFYNDLESRMLSDIYSPDPEQRIVSACENLVGPIAVISADFHVLGCSQNFSDPPANDHWAYMLHNRMLPLDTETFSRAGELMELMNHPVQMAEFIQENAAPFDYSLFNAYYDAKGKLLGFLIIASLNPITPFDKDIAGIIVQALQVTSRKVELPVRIDMPDNSDEAMLMKLLTGEEPALSEIYFKAMYPSMTEARFHVVVAQPPHDYGLPNARKRLFELFDQSVIAVHNHQIILLVWDDETSPEPEFVNKLSDLSRNTYLRFAVSNPFLRLLDGRYYLDQATYALGASATQDAVADAGVTLFKDVAISYITGDHEHESRLRARHPAVFALEQLDRKKDSDLLATLRTYLLCERSVNQAAEMLYVHRNTVMYRINQIKQLGILDLEDHRDRAYLMLSLFMDETESELSDANRDVSS